MKELNNLFARRYSSVNCEDDQYQPAAGAGFLQNAIAMNPAERHKSLQPRRSVNPSGILSSFFNERKKNHRARSPTCKYY